MLKAKKNPSSVYLDQGVLRSIASDIITEIGNSYNDFILNNTSVIVRGTFEEAELFEKDYHAFDTYLDGSPAKPVRVKVVLRFIEGIFSLSGSYDKISGEVTVEIIFGHVISFDDNSVAELFERISQGSLESAVFEILMHEFTHARETSESINRKINIYKIDKDTGEPISDRDYLNSPVEVAAFINTLISGIENFDSDRAIWDEFYKRRDVKGYLIYLMSEDSFFENLNKKNERKIILAVLEYLTQGPNRKNPSEENMKKQPQSIYVYSAVPPNAKKLIRKYGLLSGIATIKNPEVLRAARPNTKERKEFVERTKKVANSERPYSVMGPSVLFTPPDPSKITKRHFIKKWDLQTIRIDLKRLIQDYPETILWGVELLPYDKAWRDMSDAQFQKVMDKLGYASWEEFADERSRELTLSEVVDFTKQDPKNLWEHYDVQDAGKKYASNVPHAFIITPMGYIPYEYIEYVDGARKKPRLKAKKNPSELSTLKTKKNPSPVYLDQDRVRQIVEDLFIRMIDSFSDFCMRNSEELLADNFRGAEWLKVSYQAFDTYLDGTSAEPVNIVVNLEQAGQGFSYSGFYSPGQNLVGVNFLYGPRLSVRDGSLSYFFRGLIASNTMREQVFMVLMHELTHARETYLSHIRKANRYQAGPVIVSSEEADSYYNSPIEVAAFINTIVAAIEVADPDRTIWRLHSGRNIGNYIKLVSNHIGQEFSGTFNEKNKKKVYLSVLSYLNNDHRENPSLIENITFKLTHAGLVTNAAINCYYITNEAKKLSSSGVISHNNHKGIKLFPSLEEAINEAVSRLTSLRVFSGLLTNEEFLKEAKNACPEEFNLYLKSSDDQNDISREDLFFTYLMFMSRCNRAKSPIEPQLLGDISLKNVLEKIENLGIFKASLPGGSCIIPESGEFNVPMVGPVRFDSLSSIREVPMRSKRGQRAIITDPVFGPNSAKTVLIESEEGDKAFVELIPRTKCLPPYATNTTWVNSYFKYFGDDLTVDDDSPILAGLELAEVCRELTGASFIYPQFKTRGLFDLLAKTSNS